MDTKNPYYQAFCGITAFQWSLPCDPTDLVYFRKRIGEHGARLIFETSVQLHGDAAKEREVTVDTTVQEKNITFPTDLKLLEKTIKKCRRIADREGIKLRRSFKRTLPRLRMKRMKMAKKTKKMQTIAGALIRELRRKLSKEAFGYYLESLELFEKSEIRNATTETKSTVCTSLTFFASAKERRTKNTSSDARHPSCSPRPRASLSEP